MAKFNEFEAQPNESMGLQRARKRKKKIKFQSQSTGKVSEQPDLLGQAFGKKTKDIEKKALNLTKTVAKAESGGEKGFFDDDSIQNAAIGLIPILLGGLLGGADGALAGLQAGAKGLETKFAEETRVEELGKETELKERKLDISEKTAEGKSALTEAQTELAQAKAASLDPVVLAQKLQAKQQEIASKSSEGMRKEFFQATKEIGTADVLASNARIREVAAGEPSAAGDIALVFNFMKMNDPRSTVREGEFANAENARGVPESIRNIYNKTMRGEILTDIQRVDFVGQADNLLSGQLKAQQRIDDRFTELSELQAVDPRLVVDPEFERLRAQIAKDTQGEMIIKQIEETVTSMTSEERSKRIQDLRNKAGK